MNPLQRHDLVKMGMASVKDALVAEAGRRRGRSFGEWSAAEAQAVWLAARSFAQLHGLRTPALSEVVRVELQASGHCDYSSKWALYVVELRFKVEPLGG